MSMNVEMVGELTYDEYKANLDKYKRLIIRLVENFRKKINCKRLSKEDLMEEAYYGAFLGTLNYKKDKGYAWTTYVMHYVYRQLQQYIRTTLYGGLNYLPKDHIGKFSVLSNLTLFTCGDDMSWMDTYSNNILTDTKYHSSKKVEKRRYSDEDDKLIKLINSEINAPKETKQILKDVLFTYANRKELALKYKINISALNARIQKCIDQIYNSPKFMEYLRMAVTTV